MTGHRRLIALFAISGWLVASIATAADVPSSSMFEVKGVKIHYTVVGKGEPVVLIHGLYSTGESNWGKNGVIGALASDHQVIALDLPGHGQSDKPDKDDAYGMQMADDVIQLLDHLHIKKAHLVGYSLGGIIALKVIAKYPQRVLSGTLGGMGWLKQGSALEKSWEKLPGRDISKTPPVLVHSVGKLSVSEEDLKAIKVPVEVIVGDRDPVKKMYVTPLREVRSDWPVIEIPEAGHITCVMKEQFRTEIVKWIGAQAKK